MNQRKIIQITSSEHGFIDSYNNETDHFSLFALCDDGTVWDYRFSQKKWVQLPSIPQPEEESKPS